MTMVGRTTTLVGASLILLTTAFAQERSVYLRGADGTWQQIEAEVTQGAIRFRIAPEQAPDGHALVVVNKPAWMVLEDDTPPQVTGFTVDGKAFDATGPIDLGCLAQAPKDLVIEAADAENPLDPNSAGMTLGGSVGRAEVNADALGPPEKSGSFTVFLNRLPPGVYAGEVTVADLSPQGNTARMPVKFSVFGIEADPDGQTLSLSGPGSAFEVAAHKQRFLRIGTDGPTMQLTVQNAGSYLYVREFTGIETVQDTARAKAVRVSCSLQDIDDKPLEADEAATKVTYDLQLRPDLPCMIVTSRATNLGDKQSVYCFWGWLPGDGFVTSEGEREWKMEYAEIGQVGWVYLPPTGQGGTGVGWISPLRFGESRFGTMLLYTEPTHIETETDGVVEMQFAVMPADSPDEVAAAAQKLEEIGWGQ